MLREKLREFATFSLIWPVGGMRALALLHEMAQLLKAIYSMPARLGNDDGGQYIHWQQFIERKLHGVFFGTKGGNHFLKVLIAAINGVDAYMVFPDGEIQKRPSSQLKGWHIVFHGSSGARHQGSDQCSDFLRKSPAKSSKWHQMAIYGLRFLSHGEIIFLVLGSHKQNFSFA